MQFLLCSDKGFVFLIIKGNISKYGCSDERPDLLNLNRESITEGSTVIDVVGLVNTTSGIYYLPR